MSIELHMEPHANYLKCIITGEFELEEAKQAFKRMLREWNERRIPNLLVDIRQLVITSPISFRERLDFAQYAARAAIDARARGLVVKRAVFLGTTAHIDPKRFGATVATNRGARVHATTDEADAMAWLGVDETETHGHESTTPAGS